MKKTILLGTIALVATLTCRARAHEQLFGYTYLSEVLPKGKWEIEQWLTDRIGKQSGDFSATDFRTELEHGFTDRLQGSIYLNYNYYYVHNAMAGSGPLDNQNRFGIDGVSSEWMYQLFSPYKDSLGFTLYLEPGYNTIEEATGERIQEIELETKAILEKHWLDDALVGAFNYTLEPEWAKAEGEQHFNTSLKMEASTGLAYRVAPRCYAGLETRLQTEFADADLNQSEFVAAFVGPTLHYGTQRWWATLTVLPQVWGWPDSRGKGGLTLDDHERLEVRLKIGINF